MVDLERSESTLWLLLLLEPADEEDARDTAAARCAAAVSIPYVSSDFLMRLSRRQRRLTVTVDIRASMERVPEKEKNIQL